VNRHFGGMYRLHLQKNPRARNHREQVAAVCSLHGATSQKTAFFIVTAVETSDLTVEDQVFVFMSLSDSVAQLYPQSPGSLFIVFYDS
jgi:hypothetical protein